MVYKQEPVNSILKIHQELAAQLLMSLILSLVPKGRGTKVQQDSSQAESDSDCECPVCGQHYGDKSAVWIQYVKCEDWYDMECAGLDSDSLPNTYVCGNCI